MYFIGNSKWDSVKFPVRPEHKTSVFTCLSELKIDLGFGLGRDSDPLWRPNWANQYQAQLWALLDNVGQALRTRNFHSRHGRLCQLGSFTLRWRFIGLLNYLTPTLQTTCIALSWILHKGFIIVGSRFDQDYNSGQHSRELSVAAREWHLH